MRLGELVLVSSLLLLGGSFSHGHPTLNQRSKRSGTHANDGAGDATVSEPFLQKLLDQPWAYGSSSVHPTNNASSDTTFKVGIIGAGAAGLYAAILLQSLGVDYEILEANTRIGGRIYTHRFDEDAWARSKPGEPDYYNYYVSPQFVPIFLTPAVWPANNRCDSRTWEPCVCRTQSTWRGS
jgi:hypothetical protein